jgi:hypothetical protein
LSWNYENNSQVNIPVVEAVAVRLRDVLAQWWPPTDKSMLKW